MKKLMMLCLMLCAALTLMAQNDEKPGSNLVAEEGAWCWFADPRALHYENQDGTINATYIGYIDVHGNVKATQYDWVKHRKTDVLIRSYFQPDDHNNPTFLVLPDERVMIFYTRHTDEPCIWYRISQKPGDITALGEEKRLATASRCPMLKITVSSTSVLSRLCSQQVPVPMPSMRATARIRYT